MLVVPVFALCSRGFSDAVDHPNGVLGLVDELAEWGLSQVCGCAFQLRRGGEPATDEAAIGCGVLVVGTVNAPLAVVRAAGRQRRTGSGRFASLVRSVAHRVLVDLECFYVDDVTLVLGADVDRAGFDEAHAVGSRW